MGTKEGGTEVSERLAEVWDRGQALPPQEMGGRLEDDPMTQTSPFLAQPVTSYEDEDHRAQETYMRNRRPCSVMSDSLRPHGL